ncbi:MAG TPA: flagellin, partial [Aminivibrio sp.]|nr:flagellin [Aminivibrio sp.]
MRISTNLMSLASFTALSDVSNRLSKVSKKLATGLRINSASDDASGLAVSQKMRAQIRGLDRSAKNAQDGISLLQTAEGGIQEITSLLQRMRELSVQGANDVLTSEDRGHIQGEIDELSSQVDAIANQTQFNRKKLLNGDMSALWSTSTSHLSVVMPGSGRAGGTEEAAAVPSGNFRILFSTLDEGRENIQKSNILTLRNGTAGTGAVMDTGGAGLAAMSALNLAEGSWR